MTAQSRSREGESVYLGPCESEKHSLRRRYEDTATASHGTTDESAITEGDGDGDFR